MKEVNNMACTTILVGKKASYDGSTMVARNEDTGSGSFCPKKFLVMKASEQPRQYKSVISKVEIDLPDNPMQYTYTPNAINDEGIWGAYGVNTANVSMTATETLTANERLLAADPLVEYKKAIGEKDSPDYQAEQAGGIGEEDFVTLVLPYIKSAREGVMRLGSLLEEYGTYEMSGIAFQDVNEIWWLETIGGHHWYAKRVPDDHYVIMPNQLGVDNFDLEDAFGKKENHICSKDLHEFMTENHLNPAFDELINPRLIFGTATDSDHLYNTPRAWVLQRFFNQNSNVWDGPNADYTPLSNDIPWSRKPDKKITSEEVKYALSNHFQETPYDAYSKRADLKLKNSYRSIGINRTSTLGLVQLRPDLPAECMALEWVTYGCNVFNTLIPFYTNIDKTPDYLANTSEKISTDNFYWANRIIAALADSNFHLCGSYIERYQIKTVVEARKILKEYDQLIIENVNEAKKLCEEANEKLAKMLKIETDNLLDKVLFEASNNMSNAFARSDA